MCKKVLELLFVIFIFTFLFPFSNIHASSVIFSDDFNDGNSDGWEEHLGSGGNWQVVNGEYVGRVTSNSAGWSTYALAGNSNWTNYTLEVKVKGESGVDKKVKFRYKNRYEYYEVNLRSGYNDLAVGKVSPKGWLKFESVENDTDIWYTIKIVLSMSNIKISVNGEQKFDFTDTEDPILNGRIGLEAWPGAGGAVTIVHFDDVIVTSLNGTTPTPSLLPVPYFSQRDPLWASDKYDHASNWVKSGEGNTMDWWGCALTSGAMVARYFGVNKTPDDMELTPKTLNEWMQKQNDANFRNGAMNWELLERMSTKSADLFGTPKIDVFLSKVANDFLKLDSLLQKSMDGFPGLPAILETKSQLSPSGKHYVVARGKVDATYGIHDSYYQEKDLLSANPYNDHFSKLFWYEPTHSDLSTIFLVVDRDISINMLGPNIQPTGQQFDLYPLAADSENGGESGEILKMLYLENPVSGNYSIGLSTGNPQPQSYRLDIYLYDRSAEVKMATLVGWVGPGDQDNIFFYFDLENSQNSRITREVYFNTLKDDINLSYLFGWIDNDGVRNSLLAKVDAAEKASQKGDEKTEANILNALLSELGAQKEKHLNLSAYNLLKQDLETLLSQI